MTNQTTNKKRLAQTPATVVWMGTDRIEQLVAVEQPVRDIPRVDISAARRLSDRRRIERLQKGDIRISMITAAFHTNPPLNGGVKRFSMLNDRQKITSHFQIGPIPVLSLSKD